eukprot:261557_1
MDGSRHPTVIFILWIVAWALTVYLLQFVYSLQFDSIQSIATHNATIRSIPQKPPHKRQRDDIGFVSKLKSMDHVVECDINQFKYIQLLRKELSPFSLPKKWTTSSISSYRKYPAPRKKFIRLKHKNGTLYLQRDREFIYHYRNWFVYYFHHLISQYSHSIPDFDIVIFVSDGRNYVFDYHKFPFFVSEGKQRPNTPYLLHSVSRSLVRQFHLEREYQSYFNNKQNELPFKDKTNAAVFRGAPTNILRDRIAYSINKEKDIYDRFDVKLLNKMPGRQCGNKYNCLAKQRMSIEEEMKYKYQIVIDGLGVRDALSRQIRYQSVILKQQSSYKEFWYYDLINNNNSIYWNDLNHLKQIVDGRQYNNNQLYQIASNGQTYAQTHLNIDSIDCFMVHMLQIYNTYFYDDTSIKITSRDMKITLDVIYDELINCASKYSNVAREKIDTADQICLFLMKKNDTQFINALRKMQQMS